MMVYRSAMNGMAFRHFDLRVISNNSWRPVRSW